MQISPKTKQSLFLEAEVEKAICLFSLPQIAFDGRQMADYRSLKLAIYAFAFKGKPKFSILFLGRRSIHNHGQKWLIHMKIAIFSLVVNSSLSPRRGRILFPLFQYWKETTITKDFSNIVWGEGGDYRWKRCFIHSFISLKALVLLKCLNTFVHDCRLEQVRTWL